MLHVGGLGHAPIASGTFGSLPPVVLAILLVQLGQPHWLINLCLILLGIAFSIACIRFGALAEATWGRKDPGQVVADEVAGQCVALFGLPAFLIGLNLLSSSRNDPGVAPGEEHDADR